jgi:hypothetical protein
MCARSRRGRVRLFFTPHAFQNTQASFDISSTESNLVLHGSSTAAGDIIFPALDEGYYLVNGAIQGHQPIPPYAAQVNPGQITKIQISPVPLTLRLCLVRELIDKLGLAKVRFCLVEGTFDNAVVLSDNKPWANYLAVDPGELAAQKQLEDWKNNFASRYPGLGIDTSEPQLFINDALARGAADNTRLLTDKLALKINLSAPETAQAYVVFGDTGFPLTMVVNTNINRDPIPLEKAVKEVGLDLTGKLPAASQEILKKMNKYGILFIEQVAGGWLDLIMDATGLSKTQAAVIIQTYGRLLAALDKAA